MIRALPTNVTTEGLSPLGTVPQRSFELVSETVRDRLSDQHADIFAEPVATQYGDRFDWYPAKAGKVTPLVDLPQEQQATALDRLEVLLGDIHREAATLLESTNTDDQRLGEALGNATRYPGPSSVFLVGDGADAVPVIVHWAWVSSIEDKAKGSLTGVGGVKAQARQAQTQAVLAAQTAAAASSDRGPDERKPLDLRWLLWLGWILLALLIAAILYLLIAACAVRIPGMVTSCPEPELNKAELEAPVLQDRVAQAERALLDARRVCQPSDDFIAPIPEFIERAEAPQEDIEQIEDALKDAGARDGDLTFTLLWDAETDMDLHVTCPRGDEIFFQNRSACNGFLDIDNLGRGVGQKVENTVFNDPLLGNYVVRVNLYSTSQALGAVPFKLQIKSGENAQIVDGLVEPSQRSWTYTYTLRDQ
ncbi:MAG: hypothetical protein AAF198_13610 [Pseudomonadota bacterium]